MERLTEWYPSDVKPTKPGKYERRLWYVIFGSQTESRRQLTWFQRWDGSQWEPGMFNGDYQWRGLSYDPEKGGQ